MIFRISLLLLFSFSITNVFGQFQDARSFMEAYQNANTIQDLTSNVAYENISKKGRVQSRELKQYISKIESEEDIYKLLLKFTAPRDIAGTSTLTIQHEAKSDDQWLYLPAVNATKKISASKKSDRFMGTEMTYEDLSNYLSEPMDEWDYELGEKESIDGVECQQIISVPKKHTQTQYSKKILWLEPQTQQIRQIHFYTNRQELYKVLMATDIKPVGVDLYRAHQVTIENKKTGNKTSVKYSDFAINKGVSDRYFSKSYLTKK